MLLDTKLKKLSRLKVKNLVKLPMKIIINRTVIIQSAKTTLITTPMLIPRIITGALRSTKS